MRVAVRSSDFKSVERFGKEIAPLILTGPPSVTGFAGGRPKPSEVVAYWPALIPKKLDTLHNHLYVGKDMCFGPKIMVSKMKLLNRKATMAAIKIPSQTRPPLLSNTEVGRFAL